MLQNVSIRAKLLILSVVFFGVLALASGMGVYFLKHQRDDVASLYADRVVPLQQLKTVADMYAVNVVDTVHKVRDGALSAEQGAKLIAEAKSTVDKQWNAYASTFLIEKEKTLIQKIKSLMAAANVAVDRVDALIKGRDQAQLAEFAAKQLYPALDPLQEVISELILVQLDVSKEIAEDSATTYRTALLGFGGFVALAVAAGGLVASAITRAIAKPMGVAAHALERIAAGDLTVKVLASGKDETAGMLRALASMTERLSQVVSGVRSSADGVATASQQIADGNLDLSSRTEEQAASLQQTATSMEQITSTVKHNADNASQGNQLAQTASSVATRGGEVVQKVVSTMLEINNSSKKISDIIGVIDGIAFQTNILALNAAVEAARAGEQGRGFAVVATEVRSLAQRSAEAAREIKALITASVERVQVGTTLVDEAGSTMREIVASIARVADIMGEITAASNEQSSGIGQVNQAVAQMDAATQQNAALVEQASAAAASLREQANQLVQAVSVFQVTDKPA